MLCVNIFCQMKKRFRKISLMMLLMSEILQCSVLEMDLIRLVDPDPDPGGQWSTKNRKKYEILCFNVLDVLFEG